MKESLREEGRQEVRRQYRPDAQLWESARLKARQLEREIRESSASPTEKANMLHTFSKMTMYTADAVMHGR